VRGSLAASCIFPLGCFDRYHLCCLTKKVVGPQASHRVLCLERIKKRESQSKKEVPKKRKEKMRTTRLGVSIDRKRTRLVDFVVSWRLKYEDR